MHGRLLPPLVISEFAAEVVEEALEFHLGRLQRRMNEERDRADREAWARAQRRRTALHSVWSRLKHERELLGPMLPHDAEQAAHDIERHMRKMPRTAANVEALRAEKVAQVSAEDQRKAELRVQRERHKRIMGRGPEE